MNNPNPAVVVANLVRDGQPHWGADNLFLRDAGAATVAAALVLSGANVTSLSLCGNRIEDTGAVAIAQALPHAPALQRLYLAGVSPNCVLRLDCFGLIGCPFQA